MQQFIEQWGYIAVFVVVLGESAGIPLPGETALLAAAVYAANSHLAIVGVILAGIAGAVIGDNLGYWAGRKWGRTLLDRYGPRLHLTARRRERIEGYFTKYGGLTVLFGRFTALLRTWVALFAGITRLRYPTFLLFNAIGGILWATGVGLLGYLFGSNIGFLIRNLSYGLAALALILGGAYLLYRRRHKADADNSMQEYSKE